MIVQPYSDATLTPAAQAALIAAFPCMKRWWVYDRGVVAGASGSWTDQIAGEVAQVTGTLTAGANGLYGNASAIVSTQARAARFTPPASKFMFYFVLGKATTGQTAMGFDYSGYSTTAGVGAYHNIRANGTISTVDNAGAAGAPVAAGGTGTIATGNYVAQGALVDMGGSTSTRILADGVTVTGTGLAAADLTSNAGIPGGTFSDIAGTYPLAGDVQVALVATTSLATHPLGANSATGWVSQMGIMQFTANPGIPFLQAALAWMSANPNKLYPGLKGMLA